MNVLAPEEIELNKKRAVLERLKDRLADREEEMTDLRAALDQFEAQYTMEVGRLYADLDEIEALIAEEEFKLVPDDEEIKKKAEELRRRAEESAARANEAAEAGSFKLNPTPEARKAYHNLARVIHPDLALDSAEKEKRHGLMAQLNEAYSAGDQARLNKLVEDFRNSPDLITGDSAGDKLVRAIRQISQVKHRLIELREEKRSAELSELYTLRQKMQAEMAEGRNALKHMAERTRTQIKKSERRLANLKSVNQAAEEYVKDKYGMDISEFRGEGH
jgi:vacuolar-type H+-ATPase subunit I/STV1